VGISPPDGQVPTPGIDGIGTRSRALDVLEYQVSSRGTGTPARQSCLRACLPPGFDPSQQHRLISTGMAGRGWIERPYEWESRCCRGVVYSNHH